VLYELPTGGPLRIHVSLAVPFFKDLSAVLISSNKFNFLVKGVENVDSVSSLVASVRTGYFEEIDDLLSKIKGSISNVKSLLYHI
jgi:hypothetical protein